MAQQEILSANLKVNLKKDGKIKKKYKLFRKSYGHPQITIPYFEILLENSDSIEEIAEKIDASIKDGVFQNKHVSLANYKYEITISQKDGKFSLISNYPRYYIIADDKIAFKLIKSYKSWKETENEYCNGRIEKRLIEISEDVLVQFEELLNQNMKGI